MTHINQRRDWAATWVSENPVLQEGEVGWEKDTRKSKLGDGFSPWNDLDYTVSEVFVDKVALDLDLVDNTSDLDKPISTATQAVLDDKATLADLADKADAVDTQDALDAKADESALTLTQADLTATKANTIQPVASQALRDALPSIHDGMMVYREDIDVFEGRVNGAWVALPTADTGWVNLTPDAVFTSGILRYRRRGSAVYVQVDGAAVTVSGTPITLNTVMLPVALRPSLTARSGGYFGGYAGTITAGTDGSVSAVQNTGANRGSVSGILSWPVES